MTIILLIISITILVLILIAFTCVAIVCSKECHFVSPPLFSLRLHIMSQVWIGNIPSVFGEESCKQYLKDVGLPMPVKMILRSPGDGDEVKRAKYGLCTEKFGIATMASDKAKELLLAATLIWPNGRYALIRISPILNVRTRSGYAIWNLRGRSGYGGGRVYGRRGGRRGWG